MKLFIIIIVFLFFFSKSSLSGFQLTKFKLQFTYFSLQSCYFPFIGWYHCFNFNYSFLFCLWRLLCCLIWNGIRNISLNILLLSLLRKLLLGITLLWDLLLYYCLMLLLLSSLDNSSFFIYFLSPLNRLILKRSLLRLNRLLNLLLLQLSRLLRS